MDNIELRDVRVKIKLNRGADQTLITNVKGDTLKEQIEKVEVYAEDARKNIEGLGGLKVEGVQISFGQSSFFDIGSLFR